jgi:hypothetical protein
LATTIRIPHSTKSPAAIALALCAVVAGCGAHASTRATTSVNAGSQGSAGLQLIVASSDLAVGWNRFTFGLIRNNHPLSLPLARTAFFRLRGSNGTRTTSGVARFNYFARGLPHTERNQAAVALGGVYVEKVRLTRPGSWGVSVQVPYRGKTQVARQEFTVQKRSLSPAVGSAAPRSHNPTIAQEPATKLDSGRPPDDMHRLSIAGAIAQHRPLVVLFATAAYCTSRLCGPEIEVVQSLENRYRGRVNFVHIEIYKNANPAAGYAATVKQWHLVTEPWVFIVGRNGRIQAKFQGPTPASELIPAIRAALRGSGH